MAWYDDYFEDDYFLLEEPSDLETIGHIVFIKSFLDGLPPGAEVLDLGCGSGRLSVALARLGCRVTALDLKEDMLDRVRRAAEKAGKPIECHEGDMREIPFEGRYDFVLSFLHSFGYFHDEDNQRVLQAVFRALKPGGRLLLDLANRESLLGQFEAHARTWTVRNKWNVLFRRDFDAVTGRLDSNITMMQEGEETRRYLTSVRYYTWPEMKWQLRTAGFRVLEAWGSYERIPYAFHTPRMIAHAQKPEA